jgi:hypothetical protein
MIAKKVFYIIFISSVFLFSSNVLGQDEPMSQDDMMKKWMDYMTPGTMHEMMAKSVGEWTFESKYWMDPSAPPTVSEGKSVNEMILGGRYLKSMSYSDVMGMPMEGLNILAYDKATNEFLSLWIDNMGTGMTVAKGKYDENTKTAELKGTMVDPMTGKDMEYRQTMQFIDDDNQLMEMYMISDGKEVKSMEIKSTRKK